jgi:hypothetical protein
MSIWLGFDSREADAYAVARSSIRKVTTLPARINALVLDELRGRGLYTRPHEKREGCRIWDVVSGAPCATEFSNSRFLVPHLAGSGFALFMDCDVLVRRNLRDLFDLADPSKAVQVVKHRHVPTTATKMDRQVQTTYGRKNWSSVMLFNVDHPANKGLTLEMVNTLPGRDLHAFCWLTDDLIGELPPEWNHLVGEYPPNPNAAIAHFTLGVPSMAGYEDCEFADEWRDELMRWAA